MGGVVIAPSARGGTIENYENLVFTMNHIDGNVHGDDDDDGDDDGDGDGDGDDDDCVHASPHGTPLRS